MIAKCEYCGEAYNSFGSKICGKCSKELDAVFTKVRRYMYATGTALNVEQITKELEVSEKAVYYLIETGRIVTTAELGWTNRCSGCNKLIPNGTTMCPECSRNVISTLNKARNERSATLENELKGHKSGVRPMMYKEKNK